jgi:hypothetical protein
MSDKKKKKKMMQNMCTLETWEKPKEMSKNSKHPHPHGNLNHKVDDDDATSLQRCVRTSTRVQHNLGYLGVL